MRRPGRGFAARAVMVVWLLLVWVLLWGRADAAVLVGGLTMALVTYAATRLPEVPVLLRVRPRAFALALAHFGRDLVVSSVIIAWQAVRRPRRVRGALIRIETRARSDPMIVLVADSLSLQPGTLVLDLDRRSSTLLVHVMPIMDPAQIERQRRDAFEDERRLIGAFGTPGDVEVLREAPADQEDGEREE